MGHSYSWKDIRDNEGLLYSLVVSSFEGNPLVVEDQGVLLARLVLDLCKLEQRLGAPVDDERRRIMANCLVLALALCRSSDASPPLNTRELFDLSPNERTSYLQDIARHFN